MSIVAGLFRSVFPTLADNLSAQGVIRPREGGGGLIPQMFIGGTGVNNLKKAGVDLPVTLDDLAMAEFDAKTLGREAAMERGVIKEGIEIDPLADKAMYEIPDDEVRLLKGRDPEKLKGEYGFSELFKADLLTNAYPEISEVRINVYHDPKSSKVGGFDPLENTLIINASHPYIKENGFKKTVLHEVQHFIQAKEGFTMGEKFDLRLQEEPDFAMGVTAMQKALNSPMTANDLAKMLTESKGLNFSAAAVQKAMADLAASPGESTQKVLERTLGNKEMADKFLTRARQYPALRGFLESKEMADEGYVKAFDKYQRVAGEQYANATMNRSELSAEQRLQRPVAQDLLAPNAMLPSSFAANQGEALKQVQYADPFASSIQSTIPEGL